MSRRRSSWPARAAAFAVGALANLRAAAADAPAYSLGGLLVDGARPYAGVFRYGRWGGASEGWGVEVGGGRAVEERVGPLAVGVRTDTVAQVFGSHGVAVAWAYQGHASARVGPLLPWVGVGVHTLTADVLRGQASAEAFSPRVALGVAARPSTRVTFGVFAYSEYFWRWFGRDDYRIQGVALDLTVEAHRQLL